VTDSPRQRLEAVVTGRVQGVGFRYFTRQTARRLDVAGWVRNDPAGTVTLVAEGPRDALEALLAAVAEGPAGAVVHAVRHEWRAASGGVAGSFEVRR
jgi:acylphosphatase